MGGGSGNKGYDTKGDDAENMCGATLEPDPRYQGCCSNIFRPGKILRDIVIGFLVVLAIAVVIAVLFVVCFYVLPDTEAAENLEESAFVGKPIEEEVNINEVELTDNTRYDVRPDVVLENIRKDKELDEPSHGDEHHGEHHHIESVAEVESVSEVLEPEDESQPQPEPEGKDHEHVMHKDHEHMHKDEGMLHEHMPTEEEGMMHKEDMPHVHMEDKSEMPHEHMHEHTAAEDKMHDEHSNMESEMAHEPKEHHEHEDIVSEMPHEHMHKEDALPHDHTHDHHDHHDHTHDNHDHAHDHHEHPHTDSQDHMHTESHDHTHDGSHDHMHDDSHDHFHAEGHEHAHPDGHLHHEDMDKGSEMTGEHTEDSHLHEHMMEHEHEGVAFAPSAPVNEDVLEVVGAPALETTPDLPTERTVISVSSPSGPGAKVQIQSSESEFTAGVLPPLFETLGPRFNGTGPFGDADESHNDETEILLEMQPEKEPEDPGFVIEEVEAPVLAEGVLATAAATTGNCRRRQVEMCSDLPYGFTSLPNWANDQTEQELNEKTLPFFRDVIVRSGCSPRARQYACGILEPPCRNDGSIVPPCRTFCRSVAATCQEFVISAVSLNSVFDCEKFPDSTDPSVCFDMTQAPGDEVLVEGSSPVPSIPTDQELPSSPIPELSPEESPAPDLPVVVIEENQTEPVVVEEIVPINVEELIVTTQEYPAESTDLAGQDPTIFSPLTTEELVETRNEEPTFLEALFGSETEIAPADDFITTEVPLPAAADSEFEVLEGELASSNVPADLCDHESFLCHDGVNCVALSAVCDGSHQCPDGSDESNCTHTGCPSGEFKCATTDLCIPNLWLCDGADDCHDNSDEDNCNADLPTGNALPPASPIATTGDHLEGLAPIGHFPFPGGYQPNTLQDNFDVIYENVSSEDSQLSHGENWPAESYEEHYDEYSDYPFAGSEERIYTDSESMNTFAYVHPNDQAIAVDGGQKNQHLASKDEEEYHQFSEEERYIHQYAGDGRSPKEFPVVDEDSGSLHNEENILEESPEINLETLSEDQSYDLLSDLQSENDYQTQGDFFSQETPIPQSEEMLNNEGPQNQLNEGLQYVASSEDFNQNSSLSEEYYDDPQSLQEQSSENGSYYYDETLTDESQIDLEYQEDSYPEPESHESLLKDSGFINEFLSVDDPWANQAASLSDSVNFSEEHLHTSSVPEPHSYSEELLQGNFGVNSNEETQREDGSPNAQNSESLYHQQESLHIHPTGGETQEKSLAEEQQPLEKDISVEVKSVSENPPSDQSESSPDDNLSHSLPVDEEQQLENYFSSYELDASKEGNSFYNGESSLEQIQNSNEQEQIHEIQHSSSILPQDLTTEKVMIESGISNQNASMEREDIAIPSDDTAITKEVTTSLTEGPTETTVSETPYRLRGYNRFYSHRRPTRPGFSRFTTEQTTTTTKPSDSATTPTTTVPFTNFRSRFQQWRTSRIPGQPSYESMRTKALRERFRGKSRTTNDRVPEDSVVESSNLHASFQRPMTRRPSDIRTSRISVPASHFYQEEFLKESAVIPEPETKESLEESEPLSEPITYHGNVENQNSQEVYSDQTSDFSVRDPFEPYGVPADINDSRLVLDQPPQTYNFEYQTDPRLLEYRRDTSEYDLANNHSPLYLPYSPVQFAKGTAPVVSPTLEPETQTSFLGEAVEGFVTTFPEAAFEETTTDFFGGETTVAASECPELQCLDGTCLAVSQLNDGVNDCPDGTDEQDFGSLF